MNFEPDRYYRVRDIAKYYKGHIQTLYKRLYALQVPVKLESGVYIVKGSDAEKLLIKRRRGPKASSVNLVD